MKKTILILTTMILGLSLFAEPADNFKAAGISVGGTGSFRSVTYNVLNEDEALKSTY